jgi:hypothetical protein
MTNFSGAYTALITPMKESGEVDYDGFRRLIEFQIAEGIDGLVPLGTTGETPTLDEYEEGKAELVKIPRLQLKLLLKDKLSQDGIRLSCQPYSTSVSPCYYALTTMIL